MKKIAIISILAVVISAMIAPQDIVAKDKKVNYLGHTYKGSVDSKKVPNGNGVMNVEGLLIEGIFESNSATDAEVCKVKFSNGEHYAKFYGTVTFDETENIVLKAGGTYSMFYHPYNDWGRVLEETKEVKEVLSEDRVVNSKDFEPTEIKLPLSFKPNFESFYSTDILNPPTTITGYYTIHLQKYDRQEKYKDYTSYGKAEEKTRTVQATAFVDLSEKEKEAAMKVVNFKDGDGRLWNWEKDGYSFIWSVVYPDGSYFKHNGKQDNKDYSDSWKVVFSDGNSVEYKPSANDQFGCLSLGNSFFLINHGLGTPKGFVKLKSSGKFSLPTNDSYGVFRVYSNYYDFETLSSQEGEKLIKENVLPYLKGKESSNDITVEVLAGNDMSKRALGKYENGKYLSEVERAALEKAAAEKEFKKNYAQACKMYGKTYVDAALNGNVIVGMPEQLFLKIYTDCELYGESANGKLYHVYKYTLRSDKRKEWYAKVLSKEVLIKNGKVSHIVNVR